MDPKDILGMLDVELWDIFYNASPATGVNELAPLPPPIPDIPLIPFELQNFDLCHQCDNLTFDFAACFCGHKICSVCISEDPSYLNSPFFITWNCPKCGLYTGFTKKPE